MLCLADGMLCLANGILHLADGKFYLATVLDFIFFEKKKPSVGDGFFRFGGCQNL
jgi:hypothetical protein